MHKTTSLGVLIGLGVWGSTCFGQEAVTPPKANVGVTAVPVRVKPIGIDTVSSAILLRRVLMGQTTFTKAFESGELKTSGILEMLSVRSQPANVMPEQKSALRLELAGLLVKERERSNIGLKDEDLPSTVREVVADYYRSVGDERAVPLYEGLLRELDAQVEKNGLIASSWIVPLAHLALYYVQSNQMQKAADTWMRGSRYSQNRMWLADISWEAARRYEQSGDLTKAAQLYKKVPSYGNGLFTGLIRYSEADKLVRQKKYKEAQRILEQPLAGPGAEKARVGLLTLLSYCHYQLDDLEVSRKLSLQAISEYEALVNPAKVLGLERSVKGAKNYLKWSNLWLKQPLIVEPRELIIRGPGAEVPKLRQEFAIRSYQPLRLTVESDSDSIKVQLGAGGTKRTGFFVERKVNVQVAPEVLEGGFENGIATITVRSLDDPEFELRLPVRATATLKSRK